jgi:RHS repeat-associated protein
MHLQARLHSLPTLSLYARLPHVRVPHVRLARYAKMLSCLIAFTMVVQLILYPFAPVGAQGIISPVGTAAPLGSEATLLPQQQQAQDRSNASVLPNTSSRRSEVGQLPLSFERNVGQVDSSVRFLSRVSGANVFFTPAEITITLIDPATKKRATDNGGKANPGTEAPTSEISGPLSRAVRMRFVAGKAKPNVVAGQELPGKVNYLLGNDRSRWHTGVSTYSSISYTGLYPGIDLRYDGLTGGRLKGTYTVAPGADPTRLRWRYEGVQTVPITVSVDAAGNLQVRVAPPPGGKDAATATAPVIITEQRPVSWQEIDGRRVAVDARYVVAPDGSVGFQLGAYDRAYPLTIDPITSYSTYLGGAGDDAGQGIAVDSSGNTYVTGYTASLDFPTTGSLQPSNSGGTDVFVTKLNATGTAAVYSTYLGGAGDDFGYAIAIDGGGDAYLTGTSGSTDFPMRNAFQPNQRGRSNAFITRLNSGGSDLVYSTYLGSEFNDPCNQDGTEIGYGIAVGASIAGSVYVTGYSRGWDFPRTPDFVFDPQGEGTCGNVFVARFDTNQSSAASRIYSGTLGRHYGQGNAVAVDGSGNAYVVGKWTRAGTQPISFPLYNALQPTYGGSGDAFVSVLNPSGTGLVYSTFLGGSGADEAQGVARDASGSVYVTGGTSSTDFPTHSPYQSANNGGQDAFVTKINSAGAAYIYSTYLGGSGQDQGHAIAVDDSNSAYIAGQTDSTDFPTASPMYAANAGGWSDAFVTKVSAAGSPLAYSTYLGGSGSDYGYGIAVDDSDSAYVAGQTDSTDFPTANPYQGANNGLNDAFVTKIGAGAGAPPNVPQANELRCGGSPSQRPTTRSAGYGVDTATGYFCYSAVDLSIPGRGVPLVFARTYNSDMAALTSTLGYGWTHNYNMYIDRDQAGNYLVHEENGSVSTFGADFSHPLRVMATLAGVNGDLLFTRIHGQERFYFKDLNGSGVYRLDKIVDRNGHVTDLIYDPASYQLSSVRDQAGRSLTFTYYPNPLGQLGWQLQRVRDDTGRQATFVYLSWELQLATDVGGTLRTYSYTSGHRLRGLAEPRMVGVIEVQTPVLTNTYGIPITNSQVLRQDYPMGRHTEFGYSVLVGANNVSTRITNTLGLVTRHDYTDNMIQKVVELPGPNQAVWDYSYQPGTTWVSSVRDPLTHSWQSAWDDKGNQVSSTDPSLGTTGYGYNLTNYLVVITHTNGLNTNFAYDARGNMLSVTRPLIEPGQPTQSVTTSYDYEDVSPSRMGDLLSVTDPLVHSWDFSYDIYGYPDKATDPLDHETDYNYDATGRLTSLVDPKGGVNRYRHNNYNEVISNTNALNFSTLYTYDSVGNLKLVVDPKLHTVRYDYNHNNELTRVTQHDLTHSDYSYDGLGRIAKQTNPLNQSTTYAYDDSLREVTVTDPLSRQTRRKYDGAGNLKVVTDAMVPPRTTTLLYYDNNQLRRVDYSDPNTADVDYTYDNVGLRDTMQDGTGTTTYRYDSLDRLKWVEHTNGSRVDYGYNLAGNVTDITYPANVDTYRRTVQRHFDDAGRMDKVWDLSGNLTTFGYDPNGNLEQILYPGGAHSTYGFDEANRVISMTHALASGPLFLLDYDRDENGMVELSQEVQPAVSDVTHQYEYDARDRLKTDILNSTSFASRTAFDLDAAGQISRTTSFPVPGDITFTDRRYDDANQLYSLVEKTGIATTRNLGFAYSRAGNRISQVDAGTTPNTPITSYAYDQANRLTTFTKHSTGQVSQYTYNGDGLRMSKPNLGIGTLNMTWDIAQGLPLLLYDGNSSYIYGPGGMLLAQAVEPGAPSAPDVPTPPDVPKSGDPKSPLTPDPLPHRYYLSDQLGNVIAQIDPYQGTLLNRYEYDAYGGRVCVSCTTGYNPFGYAGQYTDEESGLVYMRARYYDPATQQFISKDPMVGMSGQPYVYAGANPVNAVDPTGNFWDYLPDAFFIGWDIADIWNEGLNWGTGGALAADVLLGPVPFIPAGAGVARRAGKLLSHSDDIGNAISHGDDFIYLYHGSREGIIGGKLDLGIARQTRRQTHLTDEGVFFTDDVGRAATQYATPSGEVARVKVPRSLADSVRRIDPATRLPEWVFTKQEHIDLLNSTLEVLPQREAIRKWWR